MITENSYTFFATLSLFSFLFCFFFFIIVALYLRCHSIQPWHGMLSSYQPTISLNSTGDNIFSTYRQSILQNPWNHFGCLRKGSGEQYSLRSCMLITGCTFYTWSHFAGYNILDLFSFSERLKYVVIQISTAWSVAFGKSKDNLFSFLYKALALFA